MVERPNILVVCGKNKRRSRTAESIYKNDMRFDIRSVGFSPRSERQIRAADIEWADLIFVMEIGHKGRISGEYRDFDLPPIEVLDIEDEYDYMAPELIELLTTRIDSTLKFVYNI